MERSLSDFVRGLPKAELHLHIEGTLEPEMMFELAARNGIDLPYPDVDAVRDAYSFTDLQSFLDIYYLGAAVLVTQQDFDDLMYAYLERAHTDGVVRAEVFFDPQTHTERGVGFDVFMPGFLAAIDRASAELGMSVGLIMCFLRHLPGDEACETWEAARDYHNVLLGVGLDSSEVDFPPDTFEEAYRRARAAGLHAVAHAGEEGPPTYISGALDHLAAERIDHGVRAEEDDEVLARLVDHSIPLTMCPLSNLALNVVDRLEDHNLKRLMDRGVKVTINSDDPAYFGGYIGDNYVATAEALGLSEADLTLIARNSLEATFAPPEDKARWLRELDDYLAAR
ncbi:MAG: adenosine deaminase [Acidimicrobiia bacterium]|nr:adenosine deaminase [Acidimicrobiia bacterium]